MLGRTTPIPRQGSARSVAPEPPPPPEPLRAEADGAAELPEAEQPPSSPEMTLEERTLEQISNRPNLLAQPAKPTDTPSFEKERGDREVPRSASFTRADMSQIGRFPNERALVPRRFLSAELEAEFRLFAVEQRARSVVFSSFALSIALLLVCLLQARAPPPARPAAPAARRPLSALRRTERSLPPPPPPAPQPVAYVAEPESITASPWLLDAPLVGAGAIVATALFLAGRCCSGASPVPSVIVGVAFTLVFGAHAVAVAALGAPPDGVGCDAGCDRVLLPTCEAPRAPACAAALRGVAAQLEAMFHLRILGAAAAVLLATHQTARSAATLIILQAIVAAAVELFAFPDTLGWLNTVARVIGVALLLLLLLASTAREESLLRRAYLRAPPAPAARAGRPPPRPRARRGRAAARRQPSVER